jgi:hypothetical protein
MKIKFNFLFFLNLKWFFFGIFFSLAYQYLIPLAKADTKLLNGQYGCLINKNFSGFENAEPKVGPNTVNMLIYFDFSANTFAMGLTNTNNFNQPNANSSTSNLIGTITTSQGFNSNNVLISFISSNNLTGTFNTLIVNNGNTLMMIYPYNNPNAEPATGVCQKI